MKKRVKKLTLAKETLRDMDGLEMRRAAGGITDMGSCIPGGCPATIWVGCQATTSRNTCGSAYC